MSLDIHELSQDIWTEFSPESVFLYGSRARWDFQDYSDYEIWVVFKDEQYVSRTKIRELVDSPLVKVYPFRLTQIQGSTIDTPFQKNLYMWDIKTYGENLFWGLDINNIAVNSITTLDLMQDIRFQIGLATSALIAYENWNKQTSENLFYRSCLYWARVLLILEKEEFISWYANIYSQVSNIDLWEYDELVKRAFSIRIWENELLWNYLFKNISFLNQFIEERLFELVQGQIVLEWN